MSRAIIPPDAVELVDQAIARSIQLGRELPREPGEVADWLDSLRSDPEFADLDHRVLTIAREVADLEESLT